MKARHFHWRAVLVLNRFGRFHRAGSGGKEAPGVLNRFGRFPGAGLGGKEAPGACVSKFTGGVFPGCMRAQVGTSGCPRRE